MPAVPGPLRRQHHGPDVEGEVNGADFVDDGGVSDEEEVRSRLDAMEGEAQVLVEKTAAIQVPGYCMRRLNFEDKVTGYDDFSHLLACQQSG